MISLEHIFRNPRPGKFIVQKDQFFFLFKLIIQQASWLTVPSSANSFLLSPPHLFNMTGFADIAFKEAIKVKQGQPLDLNPIKLMYL